MMQPLRIPTYPLPGGAAPLGLAMFPRDGEPDTLIAVAQTGLYVPDFTGLAWRNLLDAPSPQGDIVPTAVTVTATGRIIAGVVGGVIFSDDLGASWRRAPFRTPAPAVSAVAASRDGATVLAATLEDGVFRSGDGGDHWTAWNFGLFDPCVLDLAISPVFDHDQTTLAITSTGCFVTRNEGKSWLDVPLPAGLPDLPAVCAIEIGPVWLAGTEDGHIVRFDAARNAVLVPADAAGEAIVALLPVDDWRIVAVAESGAMMIVDPKNQHVRRIVDGAPDSAVVTCACLGAGSLDQVVITGWSDGHIETTALSSMEGKA